jgi:hypothetical protein
LDNHWILQICAASASIIPPQAGVAVYECGNSGLLVAARILDDADPPVVSDTSSS